jgi:type I restriction enzyme S subunit
MGVNYSKEQMGNGVNIVNIKDLYTSQFVDVSSLEKVMISDKEIENNQLTYGDLLFVRSSVKKEGVGCSAVFPIYDGKVVFSGFIIRARLKDDILPEYVNLFLKTEKARNQMLKDLEPVGISNVNQQRIENMLIPYTDLQTQKAIIEQIENDLKSLEGLRKMKAEALKKINQILSDVWGVEFVEPENELVEDEQEN